MIIIKIQGGLGNQMFNYAFGRKISLLCEAELKFDTSSFDEYYRPYQLNCFNIRENIATDEEIRTIRDGLGLNFMSSLAFKFRRKTKPYYQQPYVIDEKFSFDQNFFKINDNTYLAGTFQSEKYFSDIRDVICNDFQIWKPIEERNKAVLELIESTDSIALHCRRGDFLTEEGKKYKLVVVEMDYYKRALEIVSSKVQNPSIFVFSDEPLWAKENLKFTFPTKYIDTNTGPGQNIEDLRLMSSCKHHIISTSTFSWWGAWIADYHRKIIVAPQQWFSDESIDTKDVIPASWEKI